MFKRLGQLSNANHIDFKGTYHMEYDPEISDHRRVTMVAYEIWQVIGYRFTLVAPTVVNVVFLHTLTVTCTGSEIILSFRVAIEHATGARKTRLGVKNPSLQQHPV